MKVAMFLLLVLSLGNMAFANDSTQNTSPTKRARVKRDANGTPKAIWGCWSASYCTSPGVGTIELGCSYEGEYHPGGCGWMPVIPGQAPLGTVQ
jgi:hypothetical protein